MKTLSFAAFLVLFTVSVSGYKAQGNVLQLTDNDFPQVIKDYSYLLVDFYAPWCSHCKTLAPIFKQAANILKQSESQIKLATFNVEQHKKIPQLYQVNGIPSLIFFVNGQRVDFSGDRSKQGIVQWVNKKILPPTSQLKTQSQYFLLSDNKNVSIVLFSTNESQLELFTHLARTDENNKYYVARENLQNSFQSGTIKLIRYFDEITTFTGDFSTLQKWISKNDRPLFLPFDDRTIKTIFQDRKKTVLLVNSDVQKNVDLRQTLIAAAKAQSKLQNPTYIYTEINKQSEYFIMFGDFYKIPLDSSRIIVLDVEKQKKLVQLGQITPQTITQFLKKVAAGQISEYGLDEAVPQLQAKTQQVKNEQINDNTGQL